MASPSQILLIQVRFPQWSQEDTLGQSQCEKSYGQRHGNDRDGSNFGFPPKKAWEGGNESQHPIYTHLLLTHRLFNNRPFTHRLQVLKIRGFSGLKLWPAWLEAYPPRQLLGSLAHSLVWQERNNLSQCLSAPSNHASGSSSNPIPLIWNTP